MKVAVLVAASLVLSVAGSTSAPEKLQFVPTGSLALKLTFTEVGEAESENFSRAGSNTSSTTSERTLMVTDVIQAVEESRITKLSRTFEEITGESESEFDSDGGSQDMSMSGSCDIEGSTVIFEWDEDDEEYTADSDEVDGDILEELEFDYHLTALLPDDEVEEGDEWTVDIEAFRLLIDPWKGLTFEWDWDGASSDDSSGDQEEPEVEEQVDGEIVATFADRTDKPPCLGWGRVGGGSVGASG